MKRTAAREHLERKKRVLTQATPSVTAHIADAVVIKQGNVFFVSQRDGCVPLADGHGFGLYFEDCRYLDGYELTVAGRALNALGVDARRGFRAIFELTNEDIRDARGRITLPKEQLGVQWKRAIDAKRCAVHDVLTLVNYGAKPIAFSLGLAFRAGFHDVFEVRGLLGKRHGRAATARWRGKTLRFRYRGVDGVPRTLDLDFSPRPKRRVGKRAEFAIRLAPHRSRTVAVSLRVSEGAPPPVARPLSREKANRVVANAEASERRSLESQTEILTDNLSLNAVLERSLRDLRMLRSRLQGAEYVAAGIPWFAALFGRDSVIAALFMLAYDPALAEQTLRLLARLQGTHVDEVRDEEPGKIPHELRVGELARSGQIPHTPYYGTVDATPLFLILLARHAAWTGQLDLFEELEPQVAAALEWIDRYGDRDGDGYVEYASPTGGALINQGWKDSGDAIVQSRGALARPPIALVEVQAYVFRAKLLVARLYERAGDTRRARALRRQARALRAQFNRDYWLESEGLYDLALQAGKKPTRVAASNAGHALWAGIAPPALARRAGARLLEPDLFSGWGIRTLSSREPAYSPLSYHRGSVWPHDNALIMRGLRRYGMDDAALCVFEGLFQAARHFTAQRLPELFCGFSRKEYDIPVRYPVACHPQAWAAASMPYMLTALLGLVPDAFKGRLHIRRPVLPSFVEHVELRQLRVGDAHVDLAFERSRSGRVSVHVGKTDGSLRVTREHR